ncbi:serine hydrolase domain-containing protein [Rhodanobacter spathiphylli]|uniref:Beta-lactamase n=1 Tax=Rhodanobacter spathiphylli B39 TaxID=1163407 RepID=I4W3M0_9GAMM|nr:serine hydrolase domain-containing protein [Rhodanobacter spathiphylli]EIL94061.1 beta-lactamase [Rhodanobacter spathiphylli B39]
MNRYAKFAAAFAITCAAGIAMAQVPSPPNPAPASSVLQVPAVPVAVAPAAALAAPAGAAHALTADDLSTFLDGMVPYMIQRGDVAGGVISVVKDGQLLFARGYGYADLEKRTPVSPETTLFRPGSTSKLFTWTAVMQQVEQGKLDLDHDVNEYLDFTIPARDGKPVTLRQLMTHTAGFEDTARGLLPRKPEDVDLERYLKAHIPARIFPPGEIVAYSNYGCGLAGYIVQRVSGERFEDYIRQHILDPLDMHHSSFAMPLPPPLAALMAKGYKSASDGKPQPFELVDPAPAGALSSSATDMANFMIAQLQGGRFGDTRILKQATAELMHSRQYTAAPGLNGFDLGFYQEDRNGQRIIGHGGDTMVFHSDLHLLLDANVGIFMSFNSAGDAGSVHVIRKAIFQAFLDRYFPKEAPAPATVATAKADAARVAGWYQASRRNDSALRMLYLFGQVNVAAKPDGTLAVSMLTDYAGKPLPWHETGPLHYSEVNGKSQLAFVADANGGIRYWATDAEVPVFLFQRVPAARSLGTVGPLLGASVAILLATLLSWFVGGWVRRHYRRPLQLTALQLRTRLLSHLGVLALLAVVLGWLTFIAVTSADESKLLDGSGTGWLYLLYVLGVFGLLGALAVLVHAVRAWMVPRRGRWVLAGETLLALAAIYLAWFIVAFGLVSFNVRF